MDQTVNFLISEYYQSKEFFKKKQIALKTESGSLVQNVANFGLKKYESAHVERDGEYHGFSIIACEDIPGILTDHKILIVLNKLKQNFDFSLAADILGIKHHYLSVGSDDLIILFCVAKWLEYNGSNAVIKIVPNLKVKSWDPDIINDIVGYVKTTRSDPIRGKIQIVSCGMNTKTNEPVVPEEWIGKEFSSGLHLHSEIDKLSFRKK